MAAASLLLSALLLAPGAFADHERAIAYIGFSTEKPFWVQLGKAVNREASHRGFDLIDLTPPSDNATDQQQLLEHAIAKHVKGIIVGANDPALLKPALDKAVQEKIPVVAIDTAIDHPAVLSLVATDNVAGAAMAGDFIVAQTGGKGGVLIIGGAEGHPNGEVRNNGVTKKARQAGMPVTIRYADWADEKAYAITVEEMARPERYSAIFACWDPGIDTVSHVIANLQLEQLPILVGFDGLQRTREFIAAGRVSATIAQDIDAMGEMAVTVLTKILAGEAYERQVLMAPYLVTADTGSGDRSKHRQPGGGRQ